MRGSELLRGSGTWVVQLYTHITHVLTSYYLIVLHEYLCDLDL